MAFLLLIFIVASSGVSSGLYYEDNDAFIEQQYASLFTGVSELLFVRKQNIGMQVAPATHCQAMMKLQQISRRVFKYIVYYAPALTPHRMRAFVSTLTTSLSGHRRSPTALVFHPVAGEPSREFKVMYANPQTGCFILVHHMRHFGRACRMLQTSSTVNQPIPAECYRVYVENCRRRDVTIYAAYCGPRLPHIVSWSK